MCSTGSAGAFKRVYEDAIVTSRHPSASAEQQQLGRTRAAELNRITSLFILRRTQDINNKYLPPKGTVYTVLPPAGSNVNSI